MSDLTVLTNKLALLIAEDVQFSDGARVISQGGAPSPLPAVLTEIDNTMLERTLVFCMDDTEIRMAVAGRRLRGISAISNGADEADAVIGTPLSREEGKVLSQAGALLLELCAQAARVTVRAEPAEPFGSSADTGLAAASLADVWSVDMDATPAPAMERFLIANVTLFNAWVFIDGGEILEQAGDADHLKTIWADQVPKFLKKHKAFASRKDGPVLVCMDNALGGKESVALAMTGEEAFVFACAPKQVGPILQSWYAITG